MAEPVFEVSTKSNERENDELNLVDPNPEGFTLPVVHGRNMEAKDPGPDPDPDPNWPTRTPLSRKDATNKHAIAEHLLALNKHNSTPLSSACTFGSLSAVAQVDPRLNCAARSSNALHLAVSAPVTPQILSLLSPTLENTVLTLSEAKADVWAASTGQIHLREYNARTIHLLIKRALKTNANFNESTTARSADALHMAVKRENIEAIKLLVKAKAHVDAASNDRESTALMRAIYKGQEATVKTLVELGASIWLQGGKQTAYVSWAIQHEKYQIAQFLLTQMAAQSPQGFSSSPLDLEGFVLLYKCAEVGEAQLITQLVSMKANIEGRYGPAQMNPLFRAVLAEKVAAVDALLKARAQVDSPDGAGLSPLYQACAIGTDEIIEMLITAKANLEYNSLLGQTPLHAACLYGRITAVQLLVKHRANLEAATRSGDVPLYMAAMGGHAHIVRILTRAGANLDSKGTDGLPLLMRAAKRNHIPALKVLLKQKCGKRYRQRVKITFKNARALNLTLGHLATVKTTLNKSPADCMLCVEDSELNRQGHIGMGNQAEVSLVICRGKHFALKLPLANRSQQSLQQEATFWACIPPHPNIVQLAALLLDSNKRVKGMLMDYHPLGSLDQGLNRDLDRLMNLFRHQDELLPRVIELARAIVHLHSWGIVHGDIALRNVLVTSGKQFVLTDFGVSRKSEQGVEANERLPLRILAPEILNARQARQPVYLTASTDVWAFGVLLWDLCSQKDPHGNVPKQEFQANGTIKLPLALTASFPKIAPVLCDCLQMDPTNRPDAHEVLFSLTKQQ